MINDGSYERRTRRASHLATPLAVLPIRFDQLVMFGDTTSPSPIVFLVKALFWLREWRQVHVVLTLGPCI